jgi:hypothetical protein
MVYNFHSRGLSFLFVKFIPRCLFFEDIVNGIIFLSSFSICLLLVYRKATDFSTLILYPATFLKVFMISRRFWWRFSDLLGIRSCYLQIGII